ncbi:MAG: efflux RND transporter periplasmic adaptor subunit [Bdellovibrionales bacterium]|nr:efflux RND transporter periplasmic adaptor subunit [Bdellovibrionales bacterium]
MKRKYLWLLAPVALVTALALLKWNETQKSTELIKPKLGSISEVIYGLGTVESYHKFNFKLGVGKTLNEIYVQEGQKVVKGTRLLRFEDGPVVVSLLLEPY